MSGAILFLIPVICGILIAHYLRQNSDNRKKYDRDMLLAKQRLHEEYRPIQTAGHKSAQRILVQKSIPMVKRQNSSQTLRVEEHRDQMERSETKTTLFPLHLSRE